LQRRRKKGKQKSLRGGIIDKFRQKIKTNLVPGSAVTSLFSSTQPAARPISQRSPFYPCRAEQELYIREEGKYCVYLCISMGWDQELSGPWAKSGRVLQSFSNSVASLYNIFSTNEKFAPTYIRGIHADKPFHSFIISKISGMCLMWKITCYEMD
jgi:hypothetical protein